MSSDASLEVYILLICSIFPKPLESFYFMSIFLYSIIADSGKVVKSIKCQVDDEQMVVNYLSPSPMYHRVNCDNNDKHAINDDEKQQ